MSLRNLIAYPLAAALAFSPIAAQAQSFDAPARAAAELQQANGQDDDSGVPEGFIAVAIVITVIVFLVLVVFDDDDNVLGITP